MAAMAVHMMQQGLLSLELCTNVRIFTNFGAKPWRFCSDEECCLAVLVCSWMLLCAECWFPLALHFLCYMERFCVRLLVCDFMVTATTTTMTTPIITTTTTCATTIPLVLHVLYCVLIDEKSSLAVRRTT